MSCNSFMGNSTDASRLLEPALVGAGLLSFFLLALLAAAAEADSATLADAAIEMGSFPFCCHRLKNSDRINSGLCHGYYYFLLKGGLSKAFFISLSSFDHPRLPLLSAPPFCCFQRERDLLSSLTSSSSS